MQQLKNFTVYKSSAGSGKTFTLVKEYLALALNDESHPPKAYKHILAITFTNKAATEMKERIIKTLKELSVDDYSALSSNAASMLKALKEHRLLNAKKQLSDDEIRNRANNVLTAILHGYSDFAIGTIDSFVYKIVKTFAFDLKIPINFEVELDADKMLSQAIDLLIAKIGADEKLTKALLDYSETKADDEKNWHIENDLKQFAHNLLKEDGSIYADKLKSLTVDDFFAIKDELFKQIKSFEQQIKVHAEKAVAAIKSSGLTNKHFYYGDSGIGAYFERFSQNDFSKIEPNTRVITTVGEDKWPGSKVSETDLIAIENIKSELLDCFNNIQIVIDKKYADYIIYNSVAVNIYSLAVLNEIEKLLTEYKTENSIIHISEFNKLISEIVLKEEAPFIYERLGEKYHNYLIDEFQDTSVMQFQNLLPLIHHSLAAGNFSMLVGDAKQAIYRWRGGEVEQFVQLPKVFKYNDNPNVLERQSALEYNYNPQFLNQNYRSKKEVIEFNNSLFRVLSSLLDKRYEQIYDSFEQKYDEKKTGGYIQIDFLQQSNSELREANLQQTLSIINDLLEKEYELKDIAILVRKNSDGNDLANYLTENNIPVISSEALLLKNSKEVNFIFSLLNYIHNSEDMVVRSEILEYLIETKKLISVSLNDTTHIKDNKKFKQLLQQVTKEFDIARFSKLSLYELCEEIIRVFRLTSSSNAYLQFYLDEVLTFSSKKNNILSEFIEYWNDKKETSSLHIPQGMNAVNIMTIHRSKGLEFPVVILPFMNNKIDKANKKIWIDLQENIIKKLPSAIISLKEELKKTPYADVYVNEINKSLLDELNVLYVAFTRAEECMFILSDTPAEKADTPKTVSDLLAFYLKNIGLWKEDVLQYTFGSIQKSERHSKAVIAPTFELKKFNFNNWRNSIKMRAAAPSIWNTDFAESKKNYGVMIHTALARIKTTDDIDAAIENMFAEGLIDKSEKEHLLHIIKELLSLPNLNSYYQSGLTIKNEAEIILPNMEIYRPDRVVINKKEAAIIDYKTGKQKDKDKEQILNYSQVLNEMGYIVTTKILVYIENNEVVYC